MTKPEMEKAIVKLIAENRELSDRMDDVERRLRNLQSNRSPEEDPDPSHK